MTTAVFLVDSDATHLTLVAGPHLSDAWRQATNLVVLTAGKSGACGTAISRRRQVIVPDVNVDPTYEPFREAARAAGIAATWSTPFFAKDRRVLGSFAVYSRTAGLPDERHLQLVERATHLASIAVERHQIEEGLRKSESLLRLVLDALPVSVTVLNLAGEIILTNPATNRLLNRVTRSGRRRFAEIKGWRHAAGTRLAADEWPALRALAGDSTVREVLDIEVLDGGRRVFENSAVPIRDANNRITGAVSVGEDITDRINAEQKLNDSYQHTRALTARLMRAQDDERRRIAQMLHETTAQDLAALKMLLARLNRTSDRLGDNDRSALAESIALAEQSMTEVRTLSYLLHPPFLDEAGLLSALRWYAAGFSERSGIKVSLDLPDSFERLPLDTETALFRIVQESLINIHRHAGSETASIRLRRDAGALTLQIEDKGHGIPKSSLEHITSGGGAAGVGIPGMSERIEQLGGALDFLSTDHGTTGTTVRVRLPLGKAAR
jgi:signal transduction histidine kinase